MMTLLYIVDDYVIYRFLNTEGDLSIIKWKKLSYDDLNINLHKRQTCLRKKKCSAIGQPIDLSENKRFVCMSWSC